MVQSLNKIHEGFEVLRSMNATRDLNLFLYAFRSARLETGQERN